MASSLSLQSQPPDDNDIKSTITVPVVELHDAVTEGNLTKIKTIIDQHWKSVDLVSKYHLLHTAASCGQVETVRLLITKYNWPVDCKNKIKQTPLHVACGNGHLDVIKVLVLEYKADLYACDADSDMPLHTAARRGYTDIVEWFIESESEIKCDPSTTGGEGKTILHYACYEGHIELVEVLIKRYLMNPLSNDNNGNNSLHYTVRGGREKIIRTLATNYNDLHKMAMDYRNEYDESAFDVACSSDQLHIARFFVIKYGLKKCHKDDNLLSIAVRYIWTN